MKLVRKAHLYFQQGNSDKVYEVDLCDLGSKSGAARYVVNFRYGRRDKSLREGTKTVTPVTLDEANKIFDSVVVSKTNKGYKPSESTTPATESSEEAWSVQASDSDSQENPREKAILERLTAAREKAIRPNEIKRTVWRAGELGLRSAVSLVTPLIATDDELLDYCIAWTLGRCGDSSVLPSLRDLQKRYGLNATGRIAREAILSLAEADERNDIYQAIQQSLPHSLADAVESNDIARVITALEMVLQGSEPHNSTVLADLYTLARDNTVIHDALVAVVPNVILEPNTFRGIRQIYKTAEFRLDDKMFGIAVCRIDSAPPYYFIPSYGGDYAFSPKTSEYTKISKEMGKESPAFAFSNRTRDYFRRRSWRTLKKLGDLADDNYVKLATGILLAVIDDNAIPGQRSEYYDYELRQYVVRNYDPFARFVAFNYILNLNNPRITLTPSRRSWLVHEDVAEVAGFRCEAYPQLWDKQPNQLLHLLMHSQCAEVHKFAVRALEGNKGNKDFLAGIETASIITLLQKPYTETAQLALKLAKARITAGQFEADLIMALINGFSEDARQLARDVILANPNWLMDQHDMLFVIISSQYADNRLWIRRFATEVVLDDKLVQSVIARLIAHVIELGLDEGQHREVIDDIGWMLINVFVQQVRQLGFDVIDDLLDQSAESVQMIAARILISHSTDAQNLPPAMLRKLMEASSAEVRGLGVQLFGQLPDEVLLQQPALVVALAVSKDSQVRMAARPIISRLAQRDSEFAHNALQKLMGYLFLAERSEGFHDDILKLVQTDLNHVAQDLDLNTTWRLLQSRSRAAQKFGAHLLPRFKYDDFTVRQIARLGGHAIQSVRRWAWQGFDNNVARVKKDAQDALVILDNHWDEGREFGFRFFKEQFSASDWNAELLINICDSVRNDVQNFGRDLINQFFEDNDGVTYLLKLSQHPSNNVQLFASNYLKQYASENIEHLFKLKHYFITVLSQVNKARAAKTRISQFLGEEGLKSREAAALVSDIFSRQSVTSAIGDKASCIDILLKIQKRYPDIDSPLQHLPTANHGAQSKLQNQGAV